MIGKIIGRLTEEERNRLEDKLIREIREEIFSLIKDRAQDLDTIHWLISIDDCFENNNLYNENISNLRWRLWGLTVKNFNIQHLLDLATILMQIRGLVDENGEWIEKKNKKERVSKNPVGHLLSTLPAL
jgi:hypothetical protein